MEPLFFKAENDVWEPPDLGAVIRLQWSRFFSKRKIQNVYEDVSSRQSLQWSRFFSKRKMCRTMANLDPVLVGGFNGAAFFQSGKFRWR